MSAMELKSQGREAESAAADTVRLTTAQALVRFLNQQYLDVDGEVTPFVEGIFAIFGHGNVLGLGEALQEDPGHLKVYQGNNEQGMASTAIAYSRQLYRHKIFAVTASAGPGSANFVTAAGNAYVNNIPILFLPADTFATRQPDPVLQQIEVDSSATTTTNDALKPVSRYWDRIERPEQLMSALLKAFEVLTNPETAGPVTIALPQDTEGEAYDYPRSFFNKRVHVIKRIQPSAAEVTEAVQLIKASRYPVLIVGGGAKFSEAGSAIEAFSDKLNIPIVETPTGKSTISATFANNMGGTGILGTAAANEVVAKADLIIGAGTRYTDFTTASKTAIHPEKTRVLNINLNRMQSYKFDGFPIVADVRDTLTQLTSELSGYQSDFTNLADLKAAWQQERQRLAHTNYDAPDYTPEVKGQFSAATLAEYAEKLQTHFTQTEAVIAVNDTIAPDSIIVAAAGSLPGDVQRIWDPVVPNTYHMEYGYSMMGYEVPAALGIKLAQPDKESYALVGDGSFIMLHSELVTALQYHKKINILVFDNSGFASINNLQMAQGSNSYRTEFRTADHDILTIDFAKIAEGYGAKTYHVNDRDSLVAALEDAKKQTVSTLIDIKVLPKTMTQGYGQSWWRVGVSEVSDNPNVQKAYQDIQTGIDQAFKY